LISPRDGQVMMGMPRPVGSVRAPHYPGFGTSFISGQRRTSVGVMPSKRCSAQLLSVAGAISSAPALL